MTASAETKEIATRLDELRAKNPHAYPRDYAAMLGISEAEITPVFYSQRMDAPESAAGTRPSMPPTSRVANLHDLEAVFTSLAKLPRVKLMARTAFAVFELFTKVDFQREGGALVLKNDTCFVALNLAELGVVYFLSPASEKEKAAILIFDKAGAAALKIYIEAPEFDVSLLKAAAGPALAGADISALLDGARAQATAIKAGTPRKLIEDAAAQKGTVGFELSTPAIAVYMTHAPVKVVDARGWFNILDEDFNLHLKEESIHTVETGAALRLVSSAGEAIKIWSLS